MAITTTNLFLLFICWCLYTRHVCLRRTRRLSCFLSRASTTYSIQVKKVQCAERYYFPLHVSQHIYNVHLHLQCKISTSNNFRKQQKSASIDKLHLKTKHILITSSKHSHFQNEATCKTFLVKMHLICMEIKKSFSYQWFRT